MTIAIKGRKSNRFDVDLLFVVNLDRAVHAFKVIDLHFVETDAIQVFLNILFNLLRFVTVDSSVVTNPCR